ncbi:cytochrome P450 [Amycolatopsis sp. K13G38]|uniref:Cytochrome P450 n=1 Tax=Amycolatopsis acididurans TaxID=2724524 RepID=A0ABX1IYV5_9PSEU|nr:cytochrome P450 [Amycolatopsis acididurans]NKQ51305.1 cytochrome P450 [Amycolatopsis acididurans]
MMFPRARLEDSAAFTALVLMPNLVQGLFRRHRGPVRAATFADVDRHAVALLTTMSRRYDGGPVWVRAGLGRALLVLDPADVARALDGPVHDYAADPGAKRAGMVYFQPTALTISRGARWHSRRRFTEAVLGSVPRLATSIEDRAREEVKRLAADTANLTWEPWNAMVQRLARRVVLGETAAGDWALSDTLERMMDGANRLPGKPSKDQAAFHTRIAAYANRAEPGSLAAEFPHAPTDATTDPAGQVTHWLFALGDTLAVNALRTVALLGQWPGYRDRALADDGFLLACLQETMRLWPTTQLLARETLVDVPWEETVPAGTQILIVNTYLHRDPDRVPRADAFAPEQWLSGSRPQFTHFSRGPQVCPGIDLALLAGRALVRAALEHTLRVGAPVVELDAPMPHMLDFFEISVLLA